MSKGTDSCVNTYSLFSNISYESLKTMEHSYCGHRNFGSVGLAYAYMHGHKASIPLYSSCYVLIYIPKDGNWPIYGNWPNITIYFYYFNSWRYWGTKGYWFNNLNCAPRKKVRICFLYTEKSLIVLYVVIYQIFALSLCKMFQCNSTTQIRCWNFNINIAKLLHL